jgi:hypothetical protein
MLILFFFPLFFSFRFLYLELPIVQVVTHLYAWRTPRLIEFVTDSLS